MSSETQREQLIFRLLYLAQALDALAQNQRTVEEFVSIRREALASVFGEFRIGLERLLEL
jgi:hypothetical protein